MKLRHLSILLLATIFGSCGPTKVDAPDDFDELAKWFWVNQRELSDEELQEGIDTMGDFIASFTAEERATVGTLSKISSAETEWTELGTNPDKAPGFFLASRFDCPFDIAQEVITAENQGDIHPGVYDAYSRNYDGRRSTYLDGTNSLLLWQTSYSVTPTPGGAYDAKTSSGVRFVPKKEGSKYGPTIVQGTFLAESAEFENPDSNLFDHDYQIEVFTQVGDEIYHFYGLWRYLKLGSFDVNDDIVANFQFDAMVDWDGQTEDACALWPDLP